MLKFVKKILHRVLPAPIDKWMGELYFNYRYKKVQLNHLHILKRVRKKEKIKVVFFTINVASWKCESIFKLMNADERFNPIVIVIPYMIFGEDNMLREMQSCYRTFKEKGYNVTKTLNETTGHWLNVKKDIKPDIVFFTNPWTLTKEDYYITNFLNTLTCYVPYGFMLENMQKLQFDQHFHNFIWKGFYETPVHKMMAEKYARNKGENIVICGYPFCDIFLDKNYIPNDVWKIKDKIVKRIIWAPHHTIADNEKELGYSNFLNYYQLIPELLKLYNGKIQIAFKPHPILKFNLYKHPDWGMEKTVAYYKHWQNMNNGQLEEAGYEDLFLTSDAMIFDSMSFISEYCYTNKPGLFMVRDETIQKKFNEFGEMAFDLLYKAYKKEDIAIFINEIVLKGHDPKIEERTIFKENYLIPPKNLSSGFNIYQYLLKETTI